MGRTTATHRGNGGNGFATNGAGPVPYRSEPANAAANPASPDPNDPSSVVRTALCIEPRNGVLCIFMPPIDHLEDYLELVAAIEATAAELATPVVIEGYEPPHDARLSHIKVTPDPGVIEVNVPPGAKLGRVGRLSPAACTRTPTSRGSARKSSISTARTPAPVAATTWCSAARQRPTARSCGGPICSAAWSPIGTTIRRCRICSRARSSDRPARRRASTKAGAMPATSWRSRSSKPPPAARRRHGSSIASFATCWSTAPATRTAPNSASTRCFRPTAPAADWAWSSSARSKCRRTLG